MLFFSQGWLYQTTGKVSTPSVTAMIKRLEKKGYVKAYNQQTDKGRSRRYYHLTDKGAAQLIEEKSQWEVFSGAVNTVLHCGGLA